ncbi:hypothetical protein [uncultured Phascolarctobacterium sp.]|uniref:hypothetical protein n=1 Tax=uncultured Phascolarctobacterium sp. TaxID=512296 RepID=UPI0025DE2385|nr:hypothetical protein [uncultured Phascolarctobacterium sp.]
MFWEILLKYLSKNKKSIIIMILFPFIYIFLLDFFYGDKLEQGEKELREKIPTVFLYNSNIPLNEVLEIYSKPPDIISAMNSFPITTNGKDVKKYYTDKLLELGWKYSGYEAQIDHRDDEHDADRFFFDKGEYRMTLYFSPPLDVKKGSKYFYKETSYGIYFAKTKKGVLDK